MCKIETKILLTIGEQEIVGEALAPFKGKVQIATKYGIKHEGRSLICDSRPETIRKSVEGSLERLGVECIDLYYQHRIDSKIPVEEVAGVMSDHIKEGKISHWSVSEATEVWLTANEIVELDAALNGMKMSDLLADTQLNKTGDFGYEQTLYSMSYF